MLAALLLAVGCALLFVRDASLAGTVPLAAGVGLALTVLGTRVSSPFDRYADQIRDRVEESSGEEIHINVEPGGVAHINQQATDLATVRASDTLQKQEAILREIYTEGLAQAKLSFWVSVIFMSLGAIILIAGGALAIWNAPTNGAKYSAVLVSVAGVVVNLTSSVFFVQSNRTRKSMGDQGVLLREESQEDRRLSAARELAAAIEDQDLRNRVRADLAVLVLGVKERPDGEGGNGNTQGSAESES
ncbi:hypothetical protein [Dactylosporangium sp. NPDC050588]|uniref:TRADD-N-associated membrane domain-containing protein n=1 Tax=Dactylosporangium sp. NPDC050588 TaxID=3157211 RepID=UPI0033D578B7